MVSNDIPFNKSRDQRYIVGCKGDVEIVPFYIKTPPKVFSYRVFPHYENSAWTIGFNLEDHEQWAKNYKKVWKAGED